MIAAEQVLARRLLAALELAATVELPDKWMERDPDLLEGKRRSAAAVLLGLADRPGREEMLAALDSFSKRATERARQRGRGSEEAGKAPNEVRFWRNLQDAIRNVGARHDDRAGGEGEASDAPVPLRQLAAWGPLGDHFQHICAPFRDPVPREVPASEEVLTEIVRILLRAKARRWMDEDREHRRKGPS